MIGWGDTGFEVRRSYHQRQPFTFAKQTKAYLVELGFIVNGPKDLLWFDIYTLPL